MPDTPVYGLPFEQVSDEPGHSLHGGSAGGQDILAEEVETELVRIDAATSDLTDRVTTIEDKGILGWTYINHGSDAGSSFDVDLTRGGAFAAGEFDMVRFHMRFDLDAEGFPGIRVNGSSSSIYRWGYNVINAQGSITASNHGVTSAWPVGYGSTVSTNNLTCTIFHTSGDNFLNYQASSARQSDAASVHRHATLWGSLQSAVGAVPEFLRIMTVQVGVEYANAWWWVEGFRTP